VAALWDPDLRPSLCNMYNTVEHHGQTLVGALAVTEELAGQVEGLVGKSPQHFVW